MHFFSKSFLAYEAYHKDHSGHSKSYDDSKSKIFIEAVEENIVKPLGNIFKVLFPL